MPRSCKPFFAVVAALTLAVAAHAGETGSVSGVARDSQGGVLPGVLVRISGPLLPAGLERTTGANGAFQFQRLFPGSYRLDATLSGMGGAAREVRVSVDVDAQVNFTLSPAMAETVEVVAETPVADLKNTEVNFNYSAEEFEKMPLGRSYAGLFQLMPGVADNNSFAPSAGGSRQDNTFLVDGVNITNPGFGYLSTEVNELDIEDFNVKRAAISAEFGRSSGAVTNAVTRSGTNQIQGRFRFEAIPDAFIAEPEGTTVKQKRDRWIPAASLSGPLLHDKVWWYASARFYRSSLTDRTNNLGPVPDQEDKSDDYFGKLTARPTSKHLLTASYRYRPATSEFAGVGANDTPATATDQETTNKIATATWSFFPTDRTIFDFKYLHLDEENEGVARTDLGERGTFDVNNPGAMGCYFDPVLRANVGGACDKLNRQNYKRDEIKATFTQFVTWGSTQHQVKAGFGYDWGGEDLTRVSNAWGSVSRVQAGTQFATNYYPDQPSQLGNYKTYSLFLQDAITIGSRVTINAGLLFNRDDFIQETDTSTTFLTFDFGDEVQPRIGINFNVRPEAGDKVYANWGRYYAMDQKSTSRSLAPKRLYTQDTIFNSVTGALVSDAPRASTTGKVLDPAMAPTYQDEWVIGYATPLFGRWGLDVFYMNRNLNDVIEDSPRTLPDSSFWYSNLPDAERKYQAVVVELSRRFANRWSLNLSYAWSRLEGNFDIDYQTAGQSSYTSDGQIFNTSSALQDGPGLFVKDDPSWCVPSCVDRYGPLNQDRPHVFKAFASVVPVDRLTFSGYLRVQSGTPWAARGRDWYNGYRRFLEEPGSQRNDTWTNLDLLASYRFRFGERAGLTIEGRALNVFNTQTALGRDDRLYLDGRIRNTSAPPYLVQGTLQPNPTFGQPTVYAPQRRFVATVLFDF
jgi:hypothetical protein